MIDMGLWEFVLTPHKSSTPSVLLTSEKQDQETHRREGKRTGNGGIASILDDKLTEGRAYVLFISSFLRQAGGGNGENTDFWHERILD